MRSKIRFEIGSRVTATTNMLVCELGDVLRVFSSRENSAGCLARLGDAWESLGNRKGQEGSSFDFDAHNERLALLSESAGADNDFEYATWCSGCCAS